MSMPAVRELPPSTVRVVNGRVVSVHQWVLWNQYPFMTCEIRRKEDGSFFASMGDPEHGGGNIRGTLDDVLVGLHPTVQAKYKKLFALENPDPQTLLDVGFGNYKILG